MALIVHILGSKEGAPPDIHCCQVLLVGSLHNQLVDLTIHRECDGLLGHETSEFIANVLQDTSRCIWDISRVPTLEGNPMLVVSSVVHK